MKTIDELVYYCGQKNAVGALLLKGEWGCGKTYLIERKLKTALKESNVIIRVSLFGVSSIEAFHRAVKSEWIEQVGGLETGKKKLTNIFKYLEKFQGALPEGSWKGAAAGLLSIDFTSFVKVKRTIGAKTVILVFDDLERSKLSTIEMLGAINEYCENQGFKVIIIADEEKLKATQKADNELSFQVIKEKVVQRTIHFEPDFAQIVDNVITSMEDNAYKEFLLSQSSAISAMISGKTIQGEDLDTLAEKSIGKANPYRNDEDRKKDEDEARKLIDSRPHNIRSMKAAIQDYERIFPILAEYNVGDANRWFLSFLSFNMAARANLIDKDDNYGYLFSSKNMDLLYPGYYDGRYFPEPLANWVMEGRWEEKPLREYIELHYPTEKDTPASLVRSTRIDWLDESVVDEGLAAVTQEAYEGKLSYNQYVLLIKNNLIAREYGINISETDWVLVQKAIKRKIEEDVNSEKKDWNENYHEALGPKDIKECSEDELRTYQLIVDIRDNYSIVLEKNRREYIKGMIGNPEATIASMQHKKYKLFDLEMAKATLEGYKRADNPVKARFPASFENAWEYYRHSYIVKDEDKKTTEAAFVWLETELIKLLDEYQDKPFKRRFTEEFIKKIHNLYHEEEEQVDEVLQD